MFIFDFAPERLLLQLSNATSANMASARSRSRTDESHHETHRDAAGKRVAPRHSKRASTRKPVSRTSSRSLGTAITASGDLDVDPTTIIEDRFAWPFCGWHRLQQKVTFLARASPRCQTMSPC